MKDVKNDKKDQRKQEKMKTIEKEDDQNQSNWAIEMEELEEKSLPNGQTKVRTQTQKTPVWQNNAEYPALNSQQSQELKLKMDPK